MGGWCNEPETTINATDELALPVYRREAGEGNNLRRGAFSSHAVRRFVAHNRLAFAPTIIRHRLSAMRSAPFEIGVLKTNCKMALRENLRIDRIYKERVHPGDDRCRSGVSWAFIGQGDWLSGRMNRGFVILHTGAAHRQDRTAAGFSRTA